MQAQYDRIDRALILVAHGTRDARGPIELSELTAAVGRRIPEVDVRLGFLSLIEPSADQAIDDAVAAGATTVDVLPLLLTDASHAREDIPKLVAAAQLRHGEAIIATRAPIGQGQRLDSVAVTRIRSADIGPTPVVVLGRGGSNASANNNFAARVERLGSELRGSAHPAYAAIASPLLPDALDELVSRGATRIAVFGWLMAHGRLMAQARETMHYVGAVNDVEVLDLGYFLTDVESIARLITTG